MASRTLACCRVLTRNAAHCLTALLLSSFSSLISEGFVWTGHLHRVSISTFLVQRHWGSGSHRALPQTLRLLAEMTECKCAVANGATVRPLRVWGDGQCAKESDGWLAEGLLL